MPRVQRFQGESGDTLVEVLMAVVIMGIAFVGLLAGLGTAIRLSATHRGQSSADVVLVSAAESVKSQTYVPCPGLTTSSYNPTLGVTLPSGWSASNVTITSVKGWNGSAFGTFPATDLDLQLITIRATSPDNQASVETVDVVKRDPS